MWVSSIEIPNWEEAELLGVQWDRAWFDLELPHAGEKLGGWPLWAQYPTYPQCPECGGRMEMLLQIDSLRTSPYNFGDGLGQIFACALHHDQLAFSWDGC